MKLSESERVTSQLARKIGNKYDGVRRGKTSADGVEDGISTLMEFGYWNDTAYSQVERLATSFGMITTERYLEVLGEILYPNGDRDIAGRQMDQVFSTTLDVYRRGGKMPGAYFLYSYPRIVDLKQDPEEFRDQVIGAKDSGGPHFASYFAYRAPDAIEAGIPMGQFKTNSGIVKNRSSLRYAKEFMRRAPEASNSFMSFSDFTDVTLDANERLDQHSAFNALLPIVIFGQEIQIAPEEIIGDFASHTEKYGEKSAGWYSYGVRAIAERAVRQRNQRLHQPERPSAQIDIKETLTAYRSAYTSILEGAGLTTAVFFSRQFPVEEPEQFAQQLLDFREQMPRKFFNKTLWLISNWKNFKSLRDPIDVLQDVVNLTQTLPEQEVLDILNTTLKIVLNHDSISTLINPHEPRLFPKNEYKDFAEPDISNFSTTPEIQDEEDESNEVNPFLPESDTIFIAPIDYIDLWEPTEEDGDREIPEDPFDAITDMWTHILRREREERMRQQPSDLPNLRPNIAVSIERSHVGDSGIKIVDYPKSLNKNNGQMMLWEIPKND